MEEDPTAVGPPAPARLVMLVMLAFAATLVIASQIARIFRVGPALLLQLRTASLLVRWNC